MRGWRPRAKCHDARRLGCTLLVLLLAGQALAQPQATLEARPAEIPLNRLLAVTLELAWTGDADSFDIPPPDISELNGFEAIENTLSASRTNGHNVVRYEMKLKPLKQGDYDLGRIKVEYYEKGRDVRTVIPLPETRVRVTREEILGRRGKLALGTGMAAAAIAILCFLKAHSTRASRRKERNQLKYANGEHSKLLAELGAARRLLLEGRTGEYLENLCGMADSDFLRPYARTERLRELAERVRFGGETPSPDHLRWAENQVRSAIREAFPEETESGEEREGGT